MQVSTRNTPSTEGAELARQLAGFFLYLANVSNRDFLPQISELDLSLTQLKALAQLTGNTEELSMKEIAEELGLSFAATSRAVDGLSRRGLVKRDEDPVDRRVKRVRLTPRGRATVDKLTAVRVATLESLVESFSEDQRRKLAAALEPMLEREEIRRFYPKVRRR